MSKPSKIVIAPSLLAADCAKFGAEIADIAACGADWLHIDVMDGSFVPPITFGDNAVRLAKRSSKLFLDTHLMICNPERHLKAFKEAGADRVIVHQEVCPHLDRTLGEIRALGMKNGVAINPGTPVSTVYDVLDHCDLVLVMTVNPGWGGQSFISNCLHKITDLRAEIDRRKLDLLIEVDGGINDQTARQCLDTGASVLVAGTHIFGAQDRRAAISRLRGGQG